MFLLAVPVLIPLLVLTPLLIPESRDPNPGPIDLVSILLSLAAMAPVVYGIKIARERRLARSSACSRSRSGVTAAVLFVRRQLARPIPMLDMRLFRRASFSGAVLVNLLSVVSLVGFLFFVSQHLQLVLGLSPIEAGLVLAAGAGDHDRRRAGRRADRAAGAAEHRHPDRPADLGVRATGSSRSSAAMPPRRRC